MNSPRPTSPPQAPHPLQEISALFLRLGLTAFGGPAAHLILMEREAVTRRRWLSKSEFLDLVGACNLLPGPSSTQVAMALGFRRGSWPGLILAGVCFIFPAALATLTLAWAYVRYGSLPQIQGLLYGAKPVMVAIVLQAVWNLGRTACRNWTLILVGLTCFAAALAGTPPLAVLLAAGILVLLLSLARRPRATALTVAAIPIASASAAASVGLVPILLTFLKMGVVVFGSGYVLLSFLQADLVDRLHWITQPQLLDAVTAGQLTPGPVFATAAFLGYLLHGFSGAAIATLAIFLPSFFLAGIVGLLARQIRKSPATASFLDGVNSAAVALIAAVAVTLGKTALLDPWTWAIAAASLLLLLRFKINATWLILAGATLGLVIRTFR